MITLEFFFDCSSPWTYMAFTRIQPIAQRYNINIDWRPILVGGVFNAVNQELYAGREAMFSNERRMTYFMKDMQDWADLCGIRIGWPSFHPVNSVKAMRGCLIAAEQGKLVPFATAVFEAYWGREADISQDEVLRPIVQSCEMNPDDFFSRLSLPQYKDQLRQYTQELIDRGGYGSPTMFINHDDMFFGNDRLPLVERKLQLLTST